LSKCRRDLKERKGAGKGKRARKLCGRSKRRETLITGIVTKVKTYKRWVDKGLGLRTPTTGRSPGRPASEEVADTRSEMDLGTMAIPLAGARHCSNLNGSRSLQEVRATKCYFLGRLNVLRVNPKLGLVPGSCDPFA